MQAIVICGNLFDLPTLTGPLKDAGFTVTSAPTGKQAIKKLAAVDGSPKLILMDLETPGLDVAEVAATIQDPASCQLIAYGPHVHREALESAATLGCQVLTRGQLFSDVNGIVKQWSA